MITKLHRRWIDDMGRLSAQIADLEEQYRKKRARLMRDLPDGLFQGELFAARLSTYDTVSVDMEAVRRKVGERWLVRHSRRTPTRRVIVTRRRARRKDNAEDES